MEMLAYSEEERSVVIPWILDPDENDLDLEVHGCGCGCSCGCGCGCGCGCSCSCSRDSTGANDDGSDDSSASDDGNSGDDSYTALAESLLRLDPVAELGIPYDPNESIIVTATRGIGH